MCCLYGILDYKKVLTAKQKNHLLYQLSIACEERGTDATGIAYNRNGQMEIHKKPLPAHKFQKKIPKDVQVVMGHTRLTTQGNEKFNYNNHPFHGRCGKTAFALAHNGILHNEQELREEFHLSETKIETDSYVAVQMIEKTGTFDIEAIRMMAENVEGSFCFTLLDSCNNLYLVKGDNPLTIYHCETMGFYVYASTEEILQTGLTKGGFGELEYEEIKISMGDILILHPDGKIEKESFDTSKLECDYLPWFRYCNYGGLLQQGKNDGSYLECLIDYGANIGVSEDEILFLYENGFQEEEIEVLLDSPEYLQECIAEIMGLEYA